MNIRQAILHDADRCVLCGMCLPHCPTYLHTGNEAESPRGRISLMLALARGQLEVTPALTAHLDACLACRACETKCPSEVRYGRLIANARRLITDRRHPPLRMRLLVSLTTHAKLLQRALRSARTPAGRWAVRLLGLRFVEPLIPPRRERVAAVATEKTTPARGKVALFVGCTGEAFDGETLSAARTLLEAAGFVVEVPQGQTCCGALHHNMGDAAGFERRARVNLAAFGAGAPDAVVFIASGCGAMLKEYGEWITDEGAARFGARCVEITDFLARHGFPDTVHFEAMDEKVAVHLPCTQSNVLKAPGATERLLRHIPGITPAALPGNTVCCGAAGSHMLTHTATADALRQPKVDALAQMEVRYLVTTNVGCALHLAAGVCERGVKVEVVHPIVLLARRLIPPPADGLAAAAKAD